MGAEAQVVALQANFCEVRLVQPGPEGVERLLCTRRSRLGQRGEQICVGDWVRVEAIDWQECRGAIAALTPRVSLLERPAVANCTRVFVVMALAQPEPDPLQLTLFLLTAERTSLSVELVFTKSDLVSAEQAQDWCSRLDAWGYRATVLSIRSGEGIEELRERLAVPGLTVLCGPSGVGKSSLLNALMPSLELRVAAVSGRLQRGRHTTRHVELFELAAGALVADTPGFNRPDLPSDPRLLGALFPEVRARLAGAGCRFRNCLHQGDPGCAVGTDWERHPLYGICLAQVVQELDPGAVRSTQGPPRTAASRKLQRQRLQSETDADPDDLSPPDQEDSD